MKRSLKKLSIILASALVLTSLPVDSFGSEPVQEETVSETVNEEPAKEEAAAEEVKEEQGALAEVSEEPSAEEPAKEEAVSEEEKEEPDASAEVTEEPSVEEPAKEETPVEEKPVTEENPVTEEPAAENENTDADNSAVTEENAAQEGSSDNIEWEDEVDLSSDSDDEERKKRDDEDENPENEAFADEEASEDKTEEPVSYLDPGNIDMDMDFSEETVAVLSSATQLREAENEDDGKMSLASADVLDSSYYGSYENYVTAPKDQGNTKWCWAYAAASMAESSMIKNGIASKEQLSEKPVNPAHIVYTTYNPERYDYYGETWYKQNDASEFEPGRLNQSSYGINYRRWDFTSFVKITTDVNSSTPNPAYAEPLRYDDDGIKYARGNLISTVFNFERWAAPSTGDVYNFEGNNDIINAQLKNAYWVPNNDIDSIKAMIRDYGSAGIQIRINVSENCVPLKKDAVSGVVPFSDYFKYTPIYNDYSANDTVVLVAWNDDMDRNCFTDSNGNTPKKNGGFLVKNSYLASLGYGLFWISYEDAAFSLYNGKYKYAVAYDFAPAVDSDFTYGYDGTNHFGSYYTKKVYGIFKSNHSGEAASGKVEMLKSIGVGLQDAGKYQLTIYSGYDPSASKGNQYLTQYEVMTQTVEFNYPGYHTIDLDEPILFYKNDVISICFEKYDSTNFNMLVDGYIGDYGDWKSKNKTYTEGYSGASDVLYEDVMAAEDGNKYGIMYNSFTHGERENVECYFATAGDSTNIVSGNKVPVSGVSGKYLRICPRMRLYTSNIKVPKNIDQTMLDIKLKKYIWTRTGNNINPWPEVMIDFEKTEAGIPKDKGGREYPKGVVMYNRKEETVNKEKKITEFHYKLSYANNKENGIAACIVRGTGDIFSGEISIPFKIVEDQLRISRCKFLGLEDQDYKEIKAGKTLNSTYEAIKNNLIIKYYVAETKHYVTLTEGVDYKIGSIEGNNEPGKKLTVMITGIGTFKNTTKPTFKIRKATANKPISDATIGIDLSYEHDGIVERWKEGELPEVDYTGKKIKLNIDSVYDSETGRELQAGVDYKAKIKYKNNKSAGMASIVLTAEKGSGYSGKITRYFLITPMHVTTDATVKFTKTYKYTGDPIEAKPTVKLYGKKMSQKDLYVAYVNNVGSSTGEATGTGIVFGKGRYTGYIGYSTFTIKPASSTT